MKTKIITKKINTILSRVEYTIKVSFEGSTPSIKDVRNTLTTSLGVQPDKLVIRNIEQRYGSKELKVNCYVYEKIEVLRQLEPVYVLKRNGLLNTEAA
ncbi:MAG: 30S ribosomal protein S24e [Candidatus Micrarchaeota archaeon]|nr:30S ribosomal protein S24e [Candidatus Micrarchaeota archaeon]MCX8154812.1 30S ribosomal protein S24e [Candidatus Micrarchaeota archaeon]